MNLANKLTLVRIALIPIFIIFISMSNFRYGPLIALIIFIVASITDKVDGYIARSRNMITDFGKFLDPLADKLLVTAALLALVEYNLVDSWIVFVIIAREFAVTGIRAIASSKDKVIAADGLGKIKMVFQVITIIVLLLIMSLDRIITNFTNFTMLSFVGRMMMYITALMTVISGINYFYNNRDVIDVTK